MSNPRKRVLIIDEDQLLGEFYACMLSLNGFIPICAPTGLKARRIVDEDQQGFDLAVIDLMPPTEEYWSLVNHLQKAQSTQNASIVTITGISLSYEELERIKASSKAVLLKGNFELSKFKDTVAQLCN